MFNTISARQLSRYKGTDWSTEDGVMWLTIQTMAQTMTSYYYNKGMKGIANETWNHIDTIAAALSPLLKDDSNEEDKPETAHHCF
eukprot:1966865-Ditylum_brightwellii.AAC.1